MLSNKPKFNIQEEAGDRMYSSWKSYLLDILDFNNQSNAIALLNYNLEKLTTLEKERDMVLWIKMAINIHIDYRPENFLGNTLKKIYKLSTCSDEVVESIKSNLYRWPVFETLDFISLDDDVPDLISVFYKDNTKSLMHAFYQHLCTHNILDPLAVELTKNIYTPEGVEHFNLSLPTKTPFFGLVDEHRSAIFRIIKNLKPLMDKLSLEPTERLKHIASIYYITEVLTAMDYQIIANKSEPVKQMFKMEFPSEYSKYQTLKNLGFLPTPLEFFAGINSNVQAFNLPEIV